MTSKEIEELAGHRQVPAWVVKLVGDAVAAEREAVLQTIDALYEPEETPMFVEGYDAALDHIKQFIEGRNII
jgi:hypothetical protein